MLHQGAAAIDARLREHGRETPVKPSPADEIDLDEVGRLVGALERDLAKVRGGSRDVQLLRDEVETLRGVLNSPVRRHRRVESGLDAAKAGGLKAGQYLAQIGRILGM
jgi:hypothetical protein